MLNDEFVKPDPDSQDDVAQGEASKRTTRREFLERGRTVVAAGVLGGVLGMVNEAEAATYHDYSDHCDTDSHNDHWWGEEADHDDHLDGHADHTDSGAHGDDYPNPHGDYSDVTENAHEDITYHTDENNGEDYQDYTDHHDEPPFTHPDHEDHDDNQPHQDWSNHQDQHDDYTDHVDRSGNHDDFFDHCDYFDHNDYWSQ